MSVKLRINIGFQSRVLLGILKLGVFSCLVSGNSSIFNYHIRVQMGVAFWRCCALLQGEEKPLKEEDNKKEKLSEPTAPQAAGFV